MTESFQNREHMQDIELIELIEREGAAECGASNASVNGAPAGLEAAQIDAATRRLVDALRRDRAALCSLPEPEIPADLVEAIDSLIARPMLLDPAPGTALRMRQHRRQRLRFAGLGIAAVLAVGVLALVWSQVLSPGVASLQNMLAATDEEDAEVVVDLPFGGAKEMAGESLQVASAADESARWQPSEDQAVFVAADHLPGTEPEAPMLASAEPALVTADFGLVVAASDEAALVDQMRAGLQDLAGADAVNSREPIALVANMTMEEAKRLTAEILLADDRRSRGRDPGRAHVGIGSGDETVFQHEPSRSSRSNRRSRSKIGPQNLVIGSVEWAAPFEQQMAFAEKGAVLTLSVPLERLPQLLGAMQKVNALPVNVLPLSTTSDSAEDAEEKLSDQREHDRSSPLDWLDDVRAMQASIARIRAANPNAVLMIPVFFDAQPADARPRR